MIEVLFWASLALGLYPYVGYPIVAAALAALRPSRAQRTGASQPAVTVVIAAYNEARHIEATVLNKLGQTYPADRLKVIVVSDGSTDGTDDIVAALSKRDARVSVLRQEPRAGKTSALDLAMREVRSDIVVFSDANSIYRPDAISRLTARFGDPEIGYVTGSMRYVNADGSLVGDGCSAFMRYENWLRTIETRLGSIVGVDGGIDAVRRELYRPMRADQLPDFVLPLSVVEQGYRVVYEPDAVLAEDSLGDAQSEFRMRVRVALRALWALKDKARLLSPANDALFAFQLASHKLLRYLSFVPLMMASLLNLLLLEEGVIYQITLAAQIAFWLLAWAAWRLPSAGRVPAAKYCLYFALVNVASALATWRFLKGEKQMLWQPRVG